MIQVYCGDRLVVGITQGNVDRLTKFKPLRVKLQRPVSEILVMFGRDKPHIIEQMEDAGVEISAVLRQAAELDPL